MFAAAGPVTGFVQRNPTVVIGTTILGLMAAVAIFAPYLATDPLALNPANRLKPPSEAHWFGTDHLGRDVFDRTIYGTRISLTVGLVVALLSTGVGLVNRAAWNPSGGAGPSSRSGFP